MDFFQVACLRLRSTERGTRAASEDIFTTYGLLSRRMSSAQEYRERDENSQ